ncbi:unnamed protein product [Brassica rapa subsp. narinosa]
MKLIPLMCIVFVMMLTSFPATINSDCLKTIMSCMPGVEDKVPINNQWKAKCCAVWNGTITPKLLACVCRSLVSIPCSFFPHLVPTSPVSIPCYFTVESSEAKLGYISYLSASRNFLTVYVVNPGSYVGWDWFDMHSFEYPEFVLNRDRSPSRTMQEKGYYK